MKSFKSYLEHKTSWFVIIIGTILFALFIGVVLPRVSAYTETYVGGNGSPDTELLLTGRELYSIADSYGESGRSTYIFLRWTFDLIWPMVYMFFILGLIIQIGKPVKNKWVQKMYLLPIVAMLLDYLENTMLTIVMLSYPKTLYTFGTLVSYVSLMKWVVLSSAFLGIFVVIVARIVEMVGNRENIH